MQFVSISAQGYSTFVTLPELTLGNFPLGVCLSVYVCVCVCVCADQLQLFGSDFRGCIKNKLFVVNSAAALKLQLAVTSRWRRDLRFLHWNFVVFFWDWLHYMVTMPKTCSSAVQFAIQHQQQQKNVKYIYFCGYLPWVSFELLSVFRLNAIKHREFILCFMFNDLQAAVAVASSQKPAAVSSHDRSLTFSHIANTNKTKKKKNENKTKFAWDWKIRFSAHLHRGGQIQNILRNLLLQCM